MFSSTRVSAVVIRALTRVEENAFSDSFAERPLAFHPRIGSLRSKADRFRNVTICNLCFDRQVRERSILFHFGGMHSGRLPAKVASMTIFRALCACLHLASHPSSVLSASQAFPCALSLHPRSPRPKVPLFRCPRHLSVEGGKTEVR